MPSSLSDNESGARDVFFHILAMVGLYASATALLILLFQYINLGFQDPLEGGYYATLEARRLIRGALASLIVAFPVYIWITRFLERLYSSSPEKRGLRVRKWLVYFTLLVVALLIGGDLITLIFKFLNGELTARFLLKVLSIFVVAGSVFAYYIWSLRRSYQDHVTWVRPFSLAVIAGVLVAVIAGFFIAGSPQQERLRQSDERRVSDLQYLQNQIVYYWQQKEALPKNLSDLEDPLRGVSVPVDPKTSELYGYEVTGDQEFSLCAIFSLPSLEVNITPVRYEYGSVMSWEHEAGKACFDRTIDEDFFPKPALEGSPAVR